MGQTSSVEARVRDLLGRMSLEEKIAQLGSVWAQALLEGGKSSREKARKFLSKGIGQITGITGSHEVNMGFEVGNAGAHAGDEVAHLYVCVVVASVSRPI